MEGNVMKSAKWLAVAVVALASASLISQQVNASAQQSASASAAGVRASQSAGAHANVNPGYVAANGSAAGSTAVKGRGSRSGADMHGSAAGYAKMRPVSGELEGKLDSKSARVGEPVVLKTTEKMKTAGGMVIPRGSRLVGHVTEVQAHARGHEQSSLAIAFDRVELKHGQSFAIHSMIEQVRPSAAELEANAMANEDTMSGPVGVAGGGGAMAGGGLGVGHAGAGLVGGAAGAVGGAGSAVAPVGSTLNSTTEGAMNAGGGAVSGTGNLAANAAARVGRGVNGSDGAVASLGTHATAIPGVMLDSDAAGSASGTFTAARKNVHFDSGTQMVIGVMAAR
jgi:hypothetical protein